MRWPLLTRYSLSSLERAASTTSLLMRSITAGVNYFIRNPDGTVKMNDQQYFLFFVVLMLVAATVFVLVAMFYRGKTYLQSQEKPLEELEPAMATEIGMP